MKNKKKLIIIFIVLLIIILILSLIFGLNYDKNNKNEVKEVSPYVHDWVRDNPNDPDIIRCKNHPEEEYHIGYYVEYEPVGTKEALIDEEGKKYYLSSANENGYGDQKIYLEDTRWIVLGVENSDQSVDGSNETLLLTTAGVLYNKENSLYFKGAIGATNGVNVLNKVCNTLYTNDTYGYARGMNMNDINNLFGVEIFNSGYIYNNERYSIIGTTKVSDMTSNNGYPYSENLLTHLGINTKLPNGTNYKDIKDVELNNYGYYYTKDDKNLHDIWTDKIIKYKPSYNQRVLTFIKNEYTWLADSSITLDNDKIIFVLGGISEYKVSNGVFGLYSSNGEEYEDCAGIRPVIVVDSVLPKQIGMD